MRRIFLFFFLNSIFSLSAQDTTASKSKNFLKDNTGISGSIGFVNTAFTSNDPNAARDPYFWQVQANLNVKLGPVNMPFSIRYNAQGGEAAYPTLPTQFGASPKYKAWTAHLGWRSLTFSEYSLSGAQFVGVGLECNPKDFWISTKALYGRFQKAEIFYDQNRIVTGIPTYERFGYGAQVQMGKKDHQIGLHAFRARDDENSLTNDALIAGVTPSENIVYGVTFKDKISKRLSIDGELNWSSLTNNLTFGEELEPSYTYLNNIGGVFTVNSSTETNKAIKANINYAADKYNLKFSYRRIDPEYLSLGAIFLNNDLEDITGTVGFALFKKKLNLNLTAGVQTNNLDNKKLSETKRFISAATANYAPNEKWNISTNYSTFTTSTNMTLVPDGPDTLRFVQISSTLGGNVMRTFKKENNTQTISFNANSSTALQDGDRMSQIYVGMLTYGLTFKQSKLTTSASFNYTQSETMINTNVMMGPVLGASKPFKEGKINVQASAGYQFLAVDGTNTGNITTARIGTTYKPAKKHGFNADAQFANRMIKEANTISEIIINAGYVYTF